MQRWLVRDLGAGVLGAGLALALGFLVFHSRAAPQHLAARSPSEEPRAPESTAPLLHIVRQGSETSDPGAEVAAPAGSASSVGAHEVTDVAAAEKAEVASIAATFAQQFDAESADPAWSRTAEASLFGSLTTLGQARSFRVDRLTCKTTLCAAQVSFSPDTKRSLAVRDLIHQSYTPNCAVFVRPAKNSADLQFNCERSRIHDFEGRGANL